MRGLCDEYAWLGPAGYLQPARRAAVEASPEDEPTGGPNGTDNASDAD